jgi:hypothetical protein
MRLPFLGKPDPGGDEAIVAWLETSYREADQVRRAQESDWYSNILFLMGRQWESVATDLRRFSRTIPQAAESTKVKVTNNQIFTLCRSAATGFRDYMARQIAVPASEDEEDKWAAEIATDFLAYRMRADKEKPRRFDELIWLLCTGRVLRKVYWDPTATGFGPGGKVLSGAGDIAIQSLDAFRFHLAPWAEAGEPPPWIIESDVRDISEINDLFPGHDVQAEEYAQVCQYRDQLLSSALTGTAATPKRKDAAILKRMYAAPTPSRPDGLYLCWANGKLLARGKLPESEMPLVTLDWWPIPGRVYPMSFVSPLRDLQRQGNISLSQIIELKNRQMRGDMVVRGGGKIEEEIRPSGAKIIHLDQMAQEFAFLKYDLNPAQAVELVGMLWEQMKARAGVHEPSLGEQTPRAVTATHVAILREADQSGLTLFRSALDDQHCLVARLKLILARNHYHVPRMIRVVGRRMAVKTGAFFGADLRGTEDVVAVPVPIVTEAQKIQMRGEAIAAGLFGPYVSTEDMLAKLEALRWTGIPDIEDDIEEKVSAMGLTLEELREIVGHIHRNKAMAEVLVSEAAKRQAGNLVAAAMQPSPAMMGTPGALGSPNEPAPPTAMGATGVAA